jgi:hypothetical protein
MALILGGIDSASDRFFPRYPIEATGERRSDASVDARSGMIVALVSNGDAGASAISVL